MLEKTVVARFYRLASSREPVREWLAGLPREDRRLIGRDAMRVEFGWPCGRKDLTLAQRRMKEYDRHV